MKMCNTTVVVLTALTLGLLLVAEGFNISEYSCRKDDICRYPEMCTCPVHITNAYIRREFYYYDNNTDECVQTVGTSDGCNHFETESDCTFYCGLDKTYENYEDK
ncbi:uncharacterized protein LOC142563096 [Dermacentor variabilis]|uniref:uncharacterized protein LOC142563096 n=1 Tax=Dermacentor variabilis TaxID=34621 RepID=UPI003F5BB3A8